MVSSWFLNVFEKSSFPMLFSRVSMYSIILALLFFQPSLAVGKKHKTPLSIAFFIVALFGASAISKNSNVPFSEKSDDAKNLLRNGIDESSNSRRWIHTK